MKDLNMVWVLGNLGNDARCQPTQGNQLMTQLVLGTSHSDKGNTEWHRICVFGKLAQRARYLRKGTRVLVQAHLQSYHWQDAQTGRRHRSISLMAHSLEVFSGGAARAQSGGSRAQGRQGQYPPPQGYGYCPPQPAEDPPPEMMDPAMMDPGFDEAGFADAGAMPPPQANPGGYGWGPPPGVENGAGPGTYGYPGGIPEDHAPAPPDNRQPGPPRPPQPAPSNLPTRRRASRSRPTGNRNSFDQTPYAQE